MACQRLERVCMKIKSFVLAFILGTVLSLHAAEYYVAPNGSPTGNGSKQSPWDLKTAFNSYAIVKAGDIAIDQTINRFNRVMVIQGTPTIQRDDLIDLLEDDGNV